MTLDPRVPATDAGSPGHTTRRARRWSAAFALMMIVWLIFSATTLTAFPKVWIDTSWTCIEPYTLLTEGRLANPMRPISGLDEHLLAPYMVQRVLLAGTYAAFGFGLFQSRALSVVAGMLILIAVYLFAQKYFDRNVALIAAVLLATDNVFFVTSRAVRADILVALFAGTAFLIFIHGMTQRTRLPFLLSGLLVGTSLYTHPNAALVLAAILIIFFLESRLRLFARQDFWIFCVSVLVAFLPYAVWVFVQDFENHFRDFVGQVGIAESADARSLGNVVRAEFQRYLDYLYFPKRLLILLVQVAAVVWGLRSRDRIPGWLAIQVLVFVVLMPAWNPGNTTSRYFIAVLPSVVILLAAMSVELIRALPPAAGARRVVRRWLAPAAGVLLVLYLLNQLAGDAYLVWKYRSHDYEAFTAEIREVIPPGSRVWGSASFWIGLHDYPYRSQITPLEEIIRFEPEYVILYDNTTWGGLSATLHRPEPPNEWFRRRGEYIEQLSHEHGKLIRRIDNEYYGNIEIYRIDR